MALYGLDCTYPDCNHDSVKGYRLRFAIFRSQDCFRCSHGGEPMPPQESLKSGIEADWYECKQCNAEWRSAWKIERNDYVFYPQQLAAAYAQMNILGAQEPGLGVHYVENHPTIPHGFTKRRIMLTQEALPKLAMYFRWRPETGEQLTPNNVFQAMFPPNASAAERRNAAARPLTPDEFGTLMQIQQTADGPRSVGSMTLLTCQHCQRPIPPKALSTLTLRECEFGD